MHQIPYYQLPEQEADFSISNLDFLPIEDTRPHRQGYFEILLFENGIGHQSIDFHSYPLPQKSISLIVPDQVHHLEIQKAKGVLLKFSENTFAPLSIDPVQLREIGMPMLAPDRFVELYVLALNIKQHSDYANRINRQIALHYLSILLLKLVSIEHEGDSGAKDEEDVIFNRFIGEVEKNFRANRTTAFYEGLLDIPYKKLNTVVKKKTGKTMMQVVYDRLMLEIKRMLVTGNISLKEIAFRLQFDSIASFSVFVKKQTSLTPMEMKQKLTGL